MLGMSEALHLLRHRAGDINLCPNFLGIFSFPFWAAPHCAWHKYGGMRAAKRHPARQGTGLGTARRTGKRSWRGNQTWLLSICLGQETSVTVELH